MKRPVAEEKWSPKSSVLSTPQHKYTKFKPERLMTQSMNSEEIKQKEQQGERHSL